MLFFQGQQAPVARELAPAGLRSSPSRHSGLANSQMLLRRHIASQVVLSLAPDQ
jgi:hypothetical protein